MDKDLKKHLAQSITVHPYQSRNKYNENSYGATFGEPCRIELRNKVIVNNKGENVLSQCQIIVDGSTLINTDCKIVLPDGTNPKILAIQEEPDENGKIYYKCIYT